MELSDVLIRLTLVTFFSGIIGFEREVNNANAGLKTHMIVGVGATIVALIQQQIVFNTLQTAYHNPDLLGALRSDPSRLIAQVVSGIGFLGAGTIIVTKRNVSGLTTAASIWSVAGLGIAIGMGFYTIAIPGFVFLFAILYVIKRIRSMTFDERLLVKYVGGLETQQEIESIFNALHVSFSQINYEVNIYGHERIYTAVYSVVGKGHTQFSDFVTHMSRNEHIISIQTTNID